MDRLVADVKELVSTAIINDRNKTKSLLYKDNVDLESVPTVAAHMRGEPPNLFKGLESQYFQTKYFKDKLQLVVRRADTSNLNLFSSNTPLHSCTQSPQERRLGSDLVRVWRKGRARLERQWDCCYDVNLNESLTQLLSNEAIRTKVCRHRQCAKLDIQYKGITVYLFVLCR